MDATTLAACTGAPLVTAANFAPHFAAGMKAFGISTPIRQAMFLANVGHESSGMTVLVESLNYTVEALLKKFSRERISEADARAYGRTAMQPANQRAIANCIYGGAWGARRLGNVNPNDGWDFRGMGALQSTGRANATALTARLRAKFTNLGVPNFGSNPMLLTEPQWAALSACAFWETNSLNAPADRGDFDGVCDVINMGRKTQSEGDSNGYAHRLELFNRAKKALA